jgi:hypothetical protein
MPPDIEQAREILGDEAAGMTDDQIAELLAVLEGLADVIINEYIAQTRHANCRPALDEAA